MRDLGSSSGIILRGERIDCARLADVDTLQLGSQTVRFFIGPGARERANTAAAG